MMISKKYRVFYFISFYSLAQSAHLGEHKVELLAARVDTRGLSFSTRRQVLYGRQCDASSANREKKRKMSSLAQATLRPPVAARPSFTKNLKNLRRNAASAKRIGNVALPRRGRSATASATLEKVSRAAFSYEPSRRAHARSRARDAFGDHWIVRWRDD